MFLFPQKYKIFKKGNIDGNFFIYSFFLSEKFQRKKISCTSLQIITLRDYYQESTG